jgi:lysophospholipase L1-like esterase
MLKSWFFRAILFFLFGTLLIIYGIAVEKYRIFPFEQIRYIKNIILPASKPSVKPRATLFDYFSPKVDVVMIGDSITQNAIWSEIFPNIKIANRGLSGDTTEAILKRMDSILSVQPKKALIMVGIIDIYSGLSVNEIIKNYVEIIEELRAKGIIVVVQSTLECSKIECEGRLDKVRQLNQKLEEYSANHNFVFVDINKRLSSSEEGLLSRYSYDGIHLIGRGYSVWAEQISGAVN